jgi:hypothetical protein
MNNKNILLAITPDTWGASIINFLNDNLLGENLRVTLCVLYTTGKRFEFDGFMDKVSALCEEKGVVLRIKHLVEDPYDELEKLTAFADLLIMQKEAMRPLALRDEFAYPGCAIVILPNRFVDISNILLLNDGSMDCISAIKQFFQIFSRQSKRLRVTLLMVTDMEYMGADNGDENLLVEYLKQYSCDVGVLTVERPLTNRNLRALQYDSHTMVVGTSGFLLSQYGEESFFKPFYDESSAVFLPSEITPSRIEKTKYQYR